MRFIDFIYPMQGELSGAFPLASEPGQFQISFSPGVFNVAGTCCAILEPDSSGLFVVLFFVFPRQVLKALVALSFNEFCCPESQCWLFRQLVQLITLYCYYTILAPQRSFCWCLLQGAVRMACCALGQSVLRLRLFPYVVPWIISSKPDTHLHYLFFACGLFIFPCW